MKVRTGSRSDSHRHQVRAENIHSGIRHRFVQVLGKLRRAFSKAETGADITGVIHDPAGLEHFLRRIQEKTFEVQRPPCQIHPRLRCQFPELPAFIFPDTAGHHAFPEHKACTRLHFDMCRLMQPRFRKWNDGLEIHDKLGSGFHNDSRALSRWEDHRRDESLLPIAA